MPVCWFYAVWEVVEKRFQVEAIQGGNRRKDALIRDK